MAAQMNYFFHSYIYIHTLVSARSSYLWGLQVYSESSLRRGSISTAQTEDLFTSLAGGKTLILLSSIYHKPISKVCLMQIHKHN